VLPHPRVKPPLEDRVHKARFPLLIYLHCRITHVSMAPTAAPRSAWRWTSPVWCLIGIATIYLVVQCFTEDQKQSGSYGCEMSYMWPTYRVVDWPDSPSNKYALYLYREQGWDRNDQVRRAVQSVVSDS
jgi:hypothetical protein